MSNDPVIRPDIAFIRKEIDRVDKALLGLIAQRLALAADVRRSKSGAKVWRPSREESHVRDLACAAGDTPPALVSRIMAELMSASLAIQGPMQLYVALEGDALKNGALIRDRFGASIPMRTYPTVSGALAAAAADPEGVAVLPAPGGMVSWWTALAQGGAMDHMKILSRLPRTGTLDWPQAVAVADAELAPSGEDETLMTLAALDLPKARLAYPDLIMRAKMDDHALISVPGFIETPAHDALYIVGVLPLPLGQDRPALHCAEPKP